MKFVCDAPGGRTWFRIETEAEAHQESVAMRHAVDKYFLRERQRAAASFKPASSAFIEQAIGLEAHLQREMPLFLTLRDNEGNGLATAMLPPEGKGTAGFQPIIVGPGNTDPFAGQTEAIRALSKHLGMPLERDCYPYGRYSLGSHI